MRVASLVPSWTETLIESGVEVVGRTRFCVHPGATKGIPVVGSKVLVMGAAFKENCPDLRNSKVADVVQRLRGYNADVEIWDPWVSPASCREEFGVNCVREQPQGPYAGIVIAVGHRQFRELGIAGIRALGTGNAVIYDIKGLFPRAETDGRF